MTKIELLKANKYLNQMENEELEILALHGQLWMYSPDTVVYQKGDKGNNFYLVEEGKLLQIDNGDKISLIKGDFFGEVSVLTGDDREATVKVIEPSKVISFDREMIFSDKFLSNKISKKIFVLLTKSMVNKLSNRLGKKVKSQNLEMGVLRVYSSNNLTVKKTEGFLNAITTAHDRILFLFLTEYKDLLEYQIGNLDLSIRRINVNSPGVWEFLGSLNPLQQIREYLNDRHERRKDEGYRNKSEEERLNLENQKYKNEIELQLIEKDRLVLENMLLENEILRERIKTYREINFSDDKIQLLLEDYYYKPLTSLNKYQDEEIITGSMILSESR